MFGIALVDKPPGMTSHDVVYQVRKKLGTKKVGHAGTLDPQATGLLVMAIGPATRFLKYIELEPKEYEFTVTFGVETDTYDADGQVVKESPVPTNLESLVLDSLIHFSGEIQQLPPMFSAVKKDGRKLYEYARKGHTVEREHRLVTVYSLELMQIQNERATFRCVCSGGTYVRTIAHDLGRMIGCGGHACALRRTAVGRFKASQAVSTEELSESSLMPLVEALEPMPVVKLTDGQIELVSHGNFVKVQYAPNERLAALADSSGQVLAVARVLENELHPECVVPLQE